MSQAEGSESPVFQKSLHLDFPEGTPDGVIQETAPQIVGYLFGDPEIITQRIDRNGSASLEVSLMTTGLKPLKAREDLTEEEQRLRELTLRHFVIIE